MASDLRERLESLLDRTDDSPGGVDARTRGSNRAAVDAKDVSIDEDAVRGAGKAGADFGQGVPVADGSEPRTKTEVAKQAVKKRAQQTRDGLVERARKKDVKDSLKKALKAQAGEIKADAFVDKRKKSRNQEVAERATDAATIRSPMGGSLRTVGDERVVTEMARSSAARSGGLLGGATVDFSHGRDREPDGDADAGMLTWSDEDASADDQDDRGAMEFDDPFGLTGGGDDDEGVWL